MALQEVHWKVRSNKNLKEKEYVFTKVVDCNLVGSCSHCCHMDESPICNFAPSEYRVKKRIEFMDAVQQFKDCFQKGDSEGAEHARNRVEAGRVLFCPHCSEVDRRVTGEEKVCKDWYNETRRKRCREAGGCCDPHCQERGDDVHEVLEGDHLVRKADKKKERRITGEAKNGENTQLSKYDYWAAHGGVDAMAEEEKGVQWICRFHHQLQDTSTTSRKGVPPKSSLEQGISANEKQRRQNRERIFRIRNKKHVFVDAVKRKVFKCCLHCEKEVKEGEEACFDLDHLIESSKLKGGLAGKGGVAGLVHNHSNAARLDDPVFFAILIEEIKKCVLLCSNCHKRKTHKWNIPLWLLEKLRLTTHEEAISLFRTREKEWWSTVKDEWWKLTAE